jgi:hypothetical protein
LVDRNKFISDDELQLMYNKDERKYELRDEAIEKVEQHIIINDFLIKVH